MRFLSAFLVALVLPFTMTAPAEASGRVDPRANKVDQCKNVKGKQGMGDIVSGMWAHDLTTARKRDCVPGWYQRIR